MPNVNVRYLTKNLLNLEAFIYSLDVQPDVICLTETFFLKQMKSPTIKSLDA